MISQLILVVLISHRASCLTYCYVCSSDTTTDSYSFTAALLAEVTSRLGSIGTGNCLQPELSAPDFFSCNGTTLCFKSYTTYTLTDGSTSVTMHSVFRGCLLLQGGIVAEYEVDGCWYEGDTHNPYINGELAAAAADTTSHTSVSVAYEGITLCLCSEDNCNAAGHTMAAAMLVVAMTLLNFL